MINTATFPAATTAPVGPGGAGSVKDSRWLTMEVCREFQRNKCSRTEFDCKFAHPPAHVEVQNGRVVCCYDSIKGKCQRREPPCKYLHPPQHLREQLLQNGRNNLILKNIHTQLLQQQLLQGGLVSLPPKVVYPPVSAAPPPTSTPAAAFLPFLNASSAPQALFPGSFSLVSPASTNDGGGLLSVSPPNMPPTSAALSVSSVAPTSTSSCMALNGPGIVSQNSLKNPLVSDYKQQSINLVSRKRALDDPDIQNTAPASALGHQMAPAQAFLSMNPFNPYTMAMKRPALADNKSGLPVFQPNPPPHHHQPPPPPPPQAQHQHLSQFTPQEAAHLASLQCAYLAQSQHQQQLGLAAAFPLQAHQPAFLHSPATYSFEVPPFSFH